MPKVTCHFRGSLVLSIHLEGSSLAHLVEIPNEQSQDGASCQPLQQGD